MIAAPAVDLRGGRCVQLVGGRPEEERVSLPDPVEVAKKWRGMGFRTLHIVDLDAALGDGDNRDLVAEICRCVRDAAPDSPATGSPAMTVQVGGGLRDDDAVASVLEAGATRAIVGTRAVDDPDWLAALAARHPGRIMVAADVRDGRVLRKGWTEASGLEVTAFVAGLAGHPLAGVLCTDVGREGRMAGIDREGMAAVVDASPHGVWVSGGISTIDELRALDEAGAAGAVLGMALYTDTLPAAEVAAEFGGGAPERVTAESKTAQSTEDRR